MIFHGKTVKLPALGGLSIAIALSVAACSRTAEKAQLAKDLDALCRIQQSFEESKRLMKKVAPAELAQERTRRLLLELKSAALLELVKGSTAGSLPREKVETVAHKGGLPEWSCPALGAN